MRAASWRSSLLFGLFVCAALASSVRASASGPNKEACVEAHSRAQDVREQGKITLARKLFMTCAQDTCPALVQADCARYADELEKTQPSLTFVSRDSQGNDLPDTSIYLDGALLLTRLDDGKPHDVDPGKHEVRFTHDGEEDVITVLVGHGEKARPVTARFATRNAVATSLPPAARAQEKTTHALGSRIALGASSGLTAAGLIVGIVGLSRVPKECSVSTHRCAAPPDSPSFDKASKAMEMSNIGWTVTGVGAVALAGAMVWYVKSAHVDTEVKPVVTSRFVGANLTQHF